MRRTLLLTLVLLLPVALSAETLPWHVSQAGYHDSTLELAEFCLEHELHSEALKLAETISGPHEERARAIIAEATGKPDTYTAENWGAYIDRREGVLERRARGAFESGQQARNVLSIYSAFGPAREAQGQKHLDGVGWLSAAMHERLEPGVVQLADAPRRIERAVGWAEPWVIVGESFTLVTDLPWARATYFADLLDRFAGIFFELLGDVIPRRPHPNVVWCCRHAGDFVEFSQQMGYAMAKEHSGMHVGSLNSVFINAERADWIGRRNRDPDNLARTMYHECAHRLVEIGLRGQTGARGYHEMGMTTEHAWIVESIAVVFEGLKINRRGHELSGLDRQRQYTIDTNWKRGRGADAPELAPVFRQGHMAFNATGPISLIDKYALVGAVGWYCLFENTDYRRAYLDLLVDYYRTDTSRRDFEQRFGVPLPEFEAQWKAWVMR